MADDERRARRRLPLYAKVALAIGVPVAFLGLVELVLVIAGYAPPRPPIYYEPFAARKEPGTVRILVLGGSAAAGYPFGPRGGPVPLLRELLRDVAPGQPTEVRNCAANALSSEGVLLVARRVLDYEPDVLIVYSGHNEYFNDPARNRAVAAWRPHRPPRWRRTRTFALARDMALLVRGGQPAADGSATRTERALAGLLGSPRDYTPGMLAPPFEARLREIVRLAADRGAAVVLCTLASNLRDVAPTQPKDRQEFSEEDRAAWLTSYSEGRALAKAGRHEAALAAFAKAAAIDPTRCDLLYEQARCHYALGHYARAKSLFVAARDRDHMGMTTTTPRNDAVRRVAGVPGAVLADAEAAFAHAAPHGICGDELFCDHVHLNLAGAMVLARCWAKALEAHGLLGPRAGWDWARARGEEAYQRELGLDAAYRAWAHVEIAHQCARPERRARFVAVYRRPQLLESARARGVAHFAAALRLAPEVVDRAVADLRAPGSFDPVALCYIALACNDLGRHEQSVNICENVLDAAPGFVLAYRVLAKAHLALGHADQAAVARARAAELEAGSAGGDKGRPRKELTQ